MKRYNHPPLIPSLTREGKCVGVKPLTGRGNVESAPSQRGEMCSMLLLTRGCMVCVGQVPLFRQGMYMKHFSSGGGDLRIYSSPFEEETGRDSGSLLREGESWVKLGYRAYAFGSMWSMGAVKSIQDKRWSGPLANPLFLPLS